MQISPQGIAFIESHEGVVLKAYRDPVGVLTIGAGLTSASGVVKVKPGMTITREEASGLLALALRQNYEPSVSAAMPGAKQHEFDAGVSFDFNTGAIRKATWVKRWRGKAAPAQIRAGLLAWNKGGGRVLPGLVRRRSEEAEILLNGRYPSVGRITPEAKVSDIAGWGVTLSGPEIEAIRKGLRDLGYEPGPSVNSVSATTARAFQRDNDLTVDGIIGRATLSTLQRRLDARRKAVAPAAASVVAAPAATTEVPADVTGVPGIELLVLCALGIWLLWLGWRYRDVVAAKLQTSLPRVAAILRSV